MTSKNTDSLKKGLSDLFYGPDGNIERAWEKLDALWKECVLRCAQAVEAIRILEDGIRRRAELADTWQRRADASAGEGNNELVRQCHQRKKKVRY
jgi:hypothetical protein